MTDRGMWPVALAIVLRLAVWAVIPDNRFASDEDGYVHAGMALATTGQQDLFWPPMTGWLIALVKWIEPAASLKSIRFLWVLLDIGVVLGVRTLARRAAHAVLGGQPARAERYAAWATATYAVYLPAISHAQFATSETLALLQLVIVLVLLTPARPAAVHAWAAAGMITGTLVLTRPSLLPLLGLLPIAFLTKRSVQGWLPRALAFVLAGSVPIGAVMAKNLQTTGEFTVSHNAAYNLYIGNQPLYAEDLNLFSPRATPEQIEFRARFFRGELQYPALAPAAFQREALDWIARHPLTFARRALGRLARVFVPKTDVLELVGGERAGSVFAPRALALLVLANVQWTLALFGGLAGVAWLLRAAPPVGRVYLAAIAGSVALCLIAISKPRYSFVFDPLLIIGATLVALSPREAARALTVRDRWILGGVAAFLLWGWAAWLVFAVSSRTAL